jgi:hypothetical protein
MMLTDAEAMPALFMLYVQMRLPGGRQGRVHHHGVVVIHHGIILTVQ